MPGMAQPPVQIPQDYCSILGLDGCGRSIGGIGSARFAQPDAGSCSFGVAHPRNYLFRGS